SDSAYGFTDYWLLKIDKNGNKKWDKRYGGSGWEGGKGYVKATSDGGFLLSGESPSPNNGNKSESSLGRMQSWIIKTDSLGNIIWDKSIYTRSSDGGGYAIPVKGGCYVIGNSSSSSSGGYKSDPRV